jgi:hypothetical protein
MTVHGFVAVDADVDGARPVIAVEHLAIFPRRQCS